MFANIRRRGTHPSSWGLYCQRPLPYIAGPRLPLGPVTRPPDRHCFGSPARPHWRPVAPGTGTAVRFHQSATSTSGSGGCGVPPKACGLDVWMAVPMGRHISSCLRRVYPDDHSLNPPCQLGISCRSGPRCGIRTPTCHWRGLRPLVWTQIWFRGGATRECFPDSVYIPWALG